MNAVGITVVVIVVIALVAIIAAFYRRTARPDWAQSDLRTSAIGFLMAVGPFFGVRVKPPNPEVPAVTREKDDAEDGQGPVQGLQDELDEDDRRRGRL